MKIFDIIGNINEAPIQDFKTIGDFDRNSSFRDPKDRKMLTNPKAQEIYKKKFSNTDFDFNMYFVNSPAANRHTEVGQVSIDWVRENLGDEVADEINRDDDAICVIFTNNKGDKRVNMTPWVMAHRISHVLSRPGVNGDYLVNAYSSFIRELSREVFPMYGIDNFPTSYSGLLRDQRAQKILQLYMYEAGTFKSARDKNLRNGIEALHELFAQYIITGKVVPAKTPTSFGNRNFSASLGHNVQDFEMVEYNHTTEQAFDLLYMEFDQCLGAFVNQIFVM